MEYVVLKDGIDAHGGAVWPLAFDISDSDTKVLLSSAVDGDAYLCSWDLRSFALNWRYSESTIVNEGVFQLAAITIRGEVPIIAGATLSGIYRWDGSTGLRLPDGDAAWGKTMRGVAIVHIPGLRPYLVSSGQDGRIYRFDPWTGETRGDPLYRHDSTATAVAVSFCGTSRAMIVSGDELGLVYRCEAGSGLLIGEPLEFDDGISLLRVGSDVFGSSPLVFIADEQGTLHCRDVTTGKQVGRPIATGQGVSSMALVGISGKLLPVTCGEDGTVRCWDPVSGQLCGILAEGTSVASAAVGGNIVLAIGTESGQISSGVVKIHPEV
ncbi:WD40 repeat domain-containing protein [Streptomyces sp. NBC_00448]|uniref:WD40 repeat domain-containing protein n=1 Tax=Streptomyces sp. NBC_00448 TaxID=2903652 RepID=UPI002E1D18C4